MYMCFRSLSGDWFLDFIFSCSTRGITRWLSDNDVIHALIKMKKIIHIYIYIYMWPSTWKGTKSSLGLIYQESRFTKKVQKIDFFIFIDSDSLVLLLYDGIVGFIRIDVFYIEKLKKQDKGLTREKGPNLHLDFSLVKFWYLWYLKTE